MGWGSRLIQKITKLLIIQLKMFEPTAFKAQSLSTATMTSANTSQEMAPQPFFSQAPSSRTDLSEFAHPESFHFKGASEEPVWNWRPMESLFQPQSSFTFHQQQPYQQAENSLPQSNQPWYAPSQAPQGSSFGSPQQRDTASGHKIDQIIDCRRSVFTKDYRFMVSMYCDCCQGRNYWLSERELRSIGDPSLQEQANQAIEFYGEGVDIRDGQMNDCEFFDYEEDEMQGGTRCGTQPESPQGRSPLVPQSIGAQLLEVEEEEEDEMCCSIDQTQATNVHELVKQGSRQFFTNQGESNLDGISDIFSDDEGAPECGRNKLKLRLQECQKPGGFGSSQSLSFEQAPQSLPFSQNLSVFGQQENYKKKRRLQDVTFEPQQQPFAPTLFKKRKENFQMCDETMGDHTMQIYQQPQNSSMSSQFYSRHQ
ncbi:hypothetical protein FGO68_gene5697 [Halteria grandinella]|uniref:Uncharacterized protein n=1 Tax=Halteria grandinella TaxID=5974 RepID=A0A8J8T1P3_HALGN|nr:hypothetical protein FGO68_gene5697 [Halteria grandinella]